MKYTVEKTEHWSTEFDERSRRMINNCIFYADNDPAGLPGHQLMLIVAKMADMLNVAQGKLMAHETKPPATS